MPTNLFFNLDHNLFSQAWRPREETTPGDLAGLKEVDGEFQTGGYQGTVRNKEVKIHNSPIQNRMLGGLGSMPNDFLFNFDHNLFSQARSPQDPGEEKIPDDLEAGDFPTLDQRLVRLV